MEEFSLLLYSVILEKFNKLSNDMWYNSEDSHTFDGDEEFYFEEKNKYIVNDETNEKQLKKNVMNLSNSVGVI